MHKKSKHIILTDDQIEFIVGMSSCIVIKKNEIRVPESDLSWIFVQSGLVVHSYSDDLGERQVHSFIESGEFRWLSDNSEIQALQESRVFEITKTQVKELCKHDSSWTHAFLTLAQKEIKFLETRLRETLQLSLEDRFKKFHKDHRKIGVPQYLIANYLGVSPVSVSRLRQKRIDKVSE